MKLQALHTQQLLVRKLVQLFSTIKRKFLNVIFFNLLKLWWNRHQHSSYSS